MMDKKEEKESMCVCVCKRVRERDWDEIGVKYIIYVFVKIVCEI